MKTVSVPLNLHQISPKKFCTDNIAFVIVFQYYTCNSDVLYSCCRQKSVLAPFVTKSHVKFQSPMAATCEPNKHQTKGWQGCINGRTSPHQQGLKLKHLCQLLSHSEMLVTILLTACAQHIAATNIVLEYNEGCNMICTEFFQIDLVHI